MQEIKQLVVLEGEEMEDFEDLLNWIDNDFDLEVFQNGEWCNSIAAFTPADFSPR